LAVEVRQAALTFVGIGVALEGVALGRIAVVHLAAIRVGGTTDVTDLVRAAVQASAAGRYAR
jgi:hypothetical protein